MKITKIEICNIASIAGEQAIDFEAEPLRTAPLFAITGDTGAGKSTLLDALCLALYNKTPRCEAGEHQRNGRELTPADTRNLLRRGCSEGWSKVTFEAQDGGLYCAEWSLRRRRTGSYGPVERRLRRIKPHGHEFDSRGIDAEVQRLVGLDYGQFTRTVVLAQNSFANFLQAKNDEKSALLESLTGTEIYSRLGQRIYRMAQEAEQAYALQKSQIEGINLSRLDEADLQKTTEAQRLLATRLEAARTAQEAARRRLEWADRYAAAREKQQAALTAATGARRDLLALGEEQRLLQRYDLLLPLQPLFREIKRTQADLADYRQECKTIEHDMALQQQQTTAAQAAAQAALGRLNEMREQRRRNAPLLKQGYEIETLVGTQNEEMARRTNEGRGLTLQLGARRKELAELQEQVRAAEENIESCERRVQAYAGHQNMIEHADALIEKLARMVEATNEMARLKKGSEHDQAERAAQNEALGHLMQQSAALEQQVRSLREALATHRTANYGRDGEALQRDVVQRAADLERLINAEALWQRLAAGYGRTEALSAEIDRLAATNRAQLLELQNAEKRAAELAALFSKQERSYTLSRSKDVVSLRGELAEGSPCPVCGATHHPYHTETEQAEAPGNNMDKIEAEYAEMKEQLTAAGKLRDDLRLATTARTATLQARRATLEAELTAQQQAEREWQKYATLSHGFAECSAAINREGRRVMISQLADNMRKDLDRAQLAADDYNRHQKEINALTAQIEEKQHLLNEAQTRAAGVKQNIVGLDTRLETYAANIKHQNELAQSLYGELGEAITLQSWWKMITENPENLRQKLMNMKQDYDANRQRLVAERQGLQLKEQALRAQEKSVGELEAQLRQNNDECQRIAEGIERQKAQLQSLFGGKTPKQVEELQQTEEAASEAEWNKQQRALQQIEESLTANSGRKHNLDDLSRKSQTRLAQLRSQLDAWILNFNHTHSATQYAEIERVLSDERDWRSLRATLQERQNAALLAEERAQAATADLDELQKSPDRTDPDTRREDCAQALADEQARTARLGEELSTVNHRLQSHRDAVSQTEALSHRLDELNRLRSDWAQLCELFGSADGRRFRAAAQNFTFDFLVRDANKQLSALTRRYSLRPVAGTLSLEIIDHDMLDQLRPVSSLSGGETFIVSLALALALAGLSSANLDIRSLFIDEGFGNLDNESLELVMDALSSLQGAQGRQVGVISHTEQIRSRIRPQIHIIKQPAGGKSLIRVEA